MSLNGRENSFVDGNRYYRFPFKLLSRMDRGFDIQEYGSGPRLAVAKPELVSDHLVPTKVDDLVLAAAGEKQ